jgi:hypothetical protein
MGKEPARGVTLVQTIYNNSRRVVVFRRQPGWNPLSNSLRQRKSFTFPENNWVLRPNPFAG